LNSTTVKRTSKRGRKGRGGGETYLRPGNPGLNEWGTGNQKKVFVRAMVTMKMAQSKVRPVRGEEVAGTKEQWVEVRGESRGRYHCVTRSGK